MGVHLYKHGLSYLSVPKVACTSLKHFFFEIENGFPFKTYKINGVQRHIHNSGYPSRPFQKEVHPRMMDHWKIAVLRDPVDRVLSCYTNRVLGFRCLAEIDISEEDREKGIVRDPDLATFIRLLWRYRKISREVDHHAQPLKTFLGTDPGFYDRLYRMNELQQLVEDVENRVGPVPKLRRMQRSGKPIGRDELNRRQLARISEIYAADYEIFGDAFGGVSVG